MTFATRALLPPLLLLVLLLGACGGGREEEAPPLPEDLRRMLEEVAEARGLEAPSGLRVRIVAPDDAVDVYTGFFSEEDRALMEEGSALYELLGYVEPGESLWDVTVGLAELTAGFYSYEEKTVWVVSEAETIDLDAFSDHERYILAHEMIHALQDHHFGLGYVEGRLTETLDAGLAWTALIEGDAMLHTSVWRGIVALPGGAPGGDLLLLANLHQPNTIPPAILRAFQFPYITGFSAMKALYDREGTEAIDALYDDPSATTTEILHPHLLGTDWAPEADMDRLLPAEAIAESLGPGWTETESGMLGEFHLANYLLGNRTGRLYPWAWGDLTGSVAAAEGWSGDHYRLFESGEERVLVVVVRFETTSDAWQFGEAHDLALAHGKLLTDHPYTFVTRDDGAVVALVGMVGRDVTFAIGTSAEVARAALEPLVEG